MIKRLVLPFAAAAAVYALPAHAQDSAPTPAPAAADAADVASDIEMGGDSITIGAGAAYVPDYEGSDDYSVVPFPAVIGSVSGFNFQLTGNRLSVDLIPNKPGPVVDVQLGPIAVVNFNRTNRDSIDDARVAALPERDTAIEVGGYLGFGKTGVITSDYDKLSISVSYRHDVTDAHDTGIIQPSINYLTPLSRSAAVSVFASAEHVEDGYATTYFTINPADSLASGLPVYYAEGGWKNYTVGGLATVAVTGDLLQGLKIVAGGTYKRMLDDFADSPIVSLAGSRDQWMGAVGLAFTF